MSKYASPSFPPASVFGQNLRPIDAARQVQTRPELRDQLAPAPAFPYDGIVEFDITDYACFKAALDDGYWGSVIVPDTANFIDFSPTGVVSTNATTTLGARKVLVWDGKAVKKDKNH